MRTFETCQSQNISNLHYSFYKIHQGKNGLHSVRWTLQLLKINLIDHLFEASMTLTHVYYKIRPFLDFVPHPGQVFLEANRSQISGNLTHKKVHIKNKLQHVWSCILVKIFRLFELPLTLEHWFCWVFSIPCLISDHGYILDLTQRRVTWGKHLDCAWVQWHI